MIAWNLPKAPQTAKNKFFESIADAKSFAEELIVTRKYRVDIGIGQINYEANIKKKGWTLEEVLNPKTSLNRVAQILKERSWFWYHSSNPFYAKRWRNLALNALQNIYSDSNFSNQTNSNYSKIKTYKSIKPPQEENHLLVYLRRKDAFLLDTQNGIVILSSIRPQTSIGIKNRIAPLIVYKDL